MRTATVPVERILAPIPPGFRKENEYEADGSGRDYAYDYLDIEEARRVVEVAKLRGDSADAMRQKAQPQAKAADWDKVLALGVAVLTTESKDLRVAAWVVEALGHLRGFAGLAAGFSLFRQLQSRYRVSSYPRGDDDSRVPQGPYEFLEGERILPLLIRRLPLIRAETGESLSYLSCKEAERPEVQTTNDDQPADSSATRLQLHDWEAAVAATSTDDLARLADDLADCLIAFRAWDRATDRLWADRKFPPSLSRIGEALIDCAHVVQRMFADPDQPEAGPLPLAIQRFTSGRPRAADRPAADPIPEPVWEEEPPARPAPRIERRPALEPDSELELAEPEPEPAATGNLLGPIEDVESAYQRIEEAAAFLRSQDPSDPVPYLLIRSLRLGELFAIEPDATAEPFPGPPSATRKELRRLATDGDWDDLIERTEQVLAQPEGRGWLDAHRLAIRGLEERGRDRAAHACQSLLAAALDRLPDLAASELDDGTPAASAETRAWLVKSVVRTARPEPPPAEPTDELAAPRPIDLAIEAKTALQAGRTEEALAIFAAILDAAAGDRVRYLATLQFAEVCVAEGLDQVVIPLLEGLLESVDQAMLRSWEGRSFFVAGADLLLAAFGLADGEVSADRVAWARARLAFLDPGAELRSRTR